MKSPGPVEQVVLLVVDVDCVDVLGDVEPAVPVVLSVTVVMSSVVDSATKVVVVESVKVVVSVDVSVPIVESAVAELEVDEATYVNVRSLKILSTKKVIMKL